MRDYKKNSKTELAVFKHIDCLEVVFNQGADIVFVAAFNTELVIPNRMFNT